jgi:DNA helicase-2/ATP-dependent DNA helicase PcrA
MSSDSQIASPNSSNLALLHNLNPEQLHAVTLPSEHALILAGAGSGKTRVLTTRIAWLLHTGQMAAGGFMAVTFTNKAAREMMTRLTSMLPLNARGMWIGTFHGLCNRLLRAHWKSANLPQTFQILDTQDQLSAIKRLYKQFGIDDERFPPKQMLWFIAVCKEDGLRASMVEAHDADSRKKIEIYQLYEDQCQREGVVDFGELLLRSYELLRDNESIRGHYQYRFRHLLIDEFQDTNKLQYAWLKLLCGPNSAIFAVGDDDQSIYAFRGARVGNMADFLREFGVQHQIKLEQNYRSSASILDTANELIRHNKGRLGKNLRTDQGQGELVRAIELPSDFGEAQWLVEEVKQLLRDGQNGDGSNGVPLLSDIAVLYRSNAQSRVLETALFNAGLSYRVYGGLRFFERAEIKHALAYLRLLENPKDDTSFLRVVNFPPRGIGARTLEQLQDAARANQLPLHDAVHLVSGKAGSLLTGFVAKIDVIREKTEGLNLREIVEWILDQSMLLEHYRAERDGADRVENLEELVNAAESFVAQEGFGRHAQALTQEGEGMINPDTGETMSPLAAFLSHAALESGDNQAQAGQDALQLMTVHAAKGLEFDAVFITGLEEALFPHENAMNDFDGLEEERRLMYVALTRARKRLYLSHSQTRMLHGQTRYNIRSRFFDELPEHALKWLSPRQPAGGSVWNARATSWTQTIQASSAKGGHSWLRSGAEVFHAKFGQGTVMALEGTGDDARAQINFSRHGMKWLALSVAKLTPV